MTVTDLIRILNRKIKQNQSQYDLDREATKIPALSSNNLDKYELLTGEDLDLKPSTVEQAKFEYSPFGKIFNKGLSEKDKKEGLFKKLENVKDRNEELINITNTTKATNNKISIQSKNLIYNSKHSFVKYRDIDEFKELSLDSFYKKLNKFNDEITGLENVSSRKEEKKELKNQVLFNSKKLYNVYCITFTKTNTTRK